MDSASWSTISPRPAIRCSRSPCGECSSGDGVNDDGDRSAAALDDMRVEEAGLNALQTQRQLFYDGWLLRLSPGTAKRARSVNPHFRSSLPLGGKSSDVQKR